MKFMACSCLVWLASRLTFCVILRCSRLFARASKDAAMEASLVAILRGSPLRGEHLRITGSSFSPPRHVELRFLAGAVAAQGAVFTDRVGALENPVLPRRQAR